MNPNVNEYNGLSYREWLRKRFLKDIDNLIGERYADLSNAELKDCLEYVIEKYGLN